MICRQCSRDAARRGLCWRHYRRYLSGELQAQAEALNEVGPYTRALIEVVERGIERLLYGDYSLVRYELPFAGLHDLVTTGVQNA